MTNDTKWKEKLTAEQYHVTRERGTERAFTGAYWDCKSPGVYVCVCCEKPLFSSDHKFDSGTGWPSFYQPLEEARVATETDRSWMMTRTEVKCRHCEAHLGHVFDDGPAPTGLRYCINSASLRLDEQEPSGGAPSGGAPSDSVPSDSAPSDSAPSEKAADESS